MNIFTNSEIAASYEGWYQTAGRRADMLEKDVLKWMLSRFSEVHTILEVGSGTGHFTRWLGEQGLRAVGLDMSRPMLTQATSLGAPVYLQGNALKLPFPAESFDLVAFITSLEFIPEPRLALAEASRVARQGILLGVLNAESQMGWQYKRKGGPIWESARFYTPRELVRIMREIGGEGVVVNWRTTLWPFWPGALPLPWGGFIGMAVKI